MPQCTITLALSTHTHIPTLTHTYIHTHTSITVDVTVGGVRLHARSHLLCPHIPTYPHTHLYTHIHSHTYQHHSGCRSGTVIPQCTMTFALSTHTHASIHPRTRTPTYIRTSASNTLDFTVGGVCLNAPSHLLHPHIPSLTHTHIHAHTSMTVDVTVGGVCLNARRHVLDIPSSAP